MQVKDVRPESFTKQIRCDRCERLFEHGDEEFDEAVTINHRAGYGSIFGDGNHVQIDLCQSCLKQTLGRWLRIVSPEQHSNAVECFVNRFQPDLYLDVPTPAKGSFVRPETLPVQERQTVDVSFSVPQRHTGVIAVKMALPDDVDSHLPPSTMPDFATVCGEAEDVLSALEVRRAQGLCNASDRAEHSVITYLCRSIQEQLDGVAEHLAVLSRQLVRTRARLTASPESAAIEQLAAQVFGSEVEAWVWLNTPHLRFSGETPLQIVEMPGGSERVKEILMAIKYGGVV